MPIYDRPTKEILREWADANLEHGQLFHKKEPIAWFEKHYPKTKSGTVAMHVEAMATNNNRVRKHHKSVKPGNNMDLFFKVGSGRFRLHNPISDPEPWYLDSVERDQAAMPSSNEQNDVDSVEDILDPKTLEEAREFAYERDLQNFLVRNMELLEPSLRVFEDSDEDVIGVEYEAGGRRIDILAVDAQGTFVVVELKVSKGYDRVVGQILRYMAWVRENLSEGKAVRGIIVANNISDDLKLATSLVSNVELVEYRMRFDIRRVS